MIRPVFSSRSLGYFVYAVVLTVAFLYVRFPSTKFKTYCENRLERLSPGSTCNIDHVVYRFPLSAVLHSIKIGRVVDGQESDIVIKSLAISGEPLQFWKNFKLEGKMYSGTFEAGLKFDTPAQTFQLTKVHLNGIDAGQFVEGIGLTDRKISGTIEFSGDYHGASNHPMDGTGKGSVRIVNGSMALMQPLLALSTIEFDKITMNVTQEKGVVHLVDGSLDGKDLGADFAGELQIASPVVNSTILLSGHLKPEDVFLQGHPREQQIVQRLLQRYKMTVLPFKVGGTVKRPLFRFST